jgi:hypothetical protein
MPRKSQNDRKTAGRNRAETPLDTARSFRDEDPTIFEHFIQNVAAQAKEWKCHTCNIVLGHIERRCAMARAYPR